MTRRRTTKTKVTTALGALVTAAALALSVPACAYAAQGVLIVNGRGHQNPGGCFAVPRFPSSVTNHTDAIAEVHTGPRCTGQVEELVYPGVTYLTETARSVFIL
ncbi:hypothetical protein ABZ953_01615 [Streptomyces sp. NPDC046465]|uniref:hypothetical protein n=1 Tax=Streptomyces sp. NPDC046465 TaxID=3155810 RepID=UPI0033C40426